MPAGATPTRQLSPGRVRIRAPRAKSRRRADSRQVGIVAEAELVLVVRLVAGVPQRSVEPEAAEQRGPVRKPRAELKAITVVGSRPTRAGGVQRRHLTVLRRIQVVNRHRRAVDQVEDRHRRPVPGRRVDCRSEARCGSCRDTGAGHRHPQQLGCTSGPLSGSRCAESSSYVVNGSTAEILRQAGDVDLAPRREIEQPRSPCAMSSRLRSVQGKVNEAAAMGLYRWAPEFASPVVLAAYAVQ